MRTGFLLLIDTAYGNRSGKWFDFNDASVHNILEEEIVVRQFTVTAIKILVPPTHSKHTHDAAHSEVIGNLQV